MINELTDIHTLAMQTSQMAGFLFFAWLLTLGPGICLLRGRHSADLMFKVTLYIFAVSLGTRICNFYYVLPCHIGEPLGYIIDHGYSGSLVHLDKPVLLTIWFCGGIAGHALIHSISMMRQFWTTARNRAAVVFYSCALIVGFLHPLPIIHFWGNFNRLILRAAQPQLEANRELTDTLTQQWILEQPSDSMFLLVRANFLCDMQGYSEALPLYEKALQYLPQEQKIHSAVIKKKIKETNKLLQCTQ